MKKKVLKKSDLTSKRFLIVLLGLTCAMVTPLYCNIYTTDVLVCIGTMVFGYLGVRAVQSMTEKEGE